MSDNDFETTDTSKPLDGYFYRTAYLTWPRALMEAMPREWQERFRELAFEIDETFEWPKGRYAVIVAFTDEDGNPYQRVRNHDPLRNYRHLKREVIEAHRKKRVLDEEGGSR